MTAGLPLVLVGLAGLAAGALAPMFLRRLREPWRAVLEGMGPALYGLLPLSLALQSGWVSRRDVGLQGPLPLAPGTGLGWPVADWVRGLGLAGLYAGGTILVLQWWRGGTLALPRRREAWEAGLAALGWEALLALLRAPLGMFLFPADPLPAAWLAFGIAWGTIRTAWSRQGRPPPIPWWAGALAGTAVFGLTGNLWMSAAAHAGTAVALSEDPSDLSLGEKAPRA